MLPYATKYPSIGTVLSHWQFNNLPINSLVLPVLKKEAYGYVGQNMLFHLGPEEFSTNA